MPVNEKGFNLKDSGSLTNPQNISHGAPCNSCKILTCDSIHGPPTQDCHLEDCNYCEDLASIDDEISHAYQNLFDLVQEREHIITKPHNNASIERLPVEMLSSIFRFVKDTYKDNSGKPMFSQPHHSPPLLVGAVCNRWRQVSLQTPHLWTDIVLDLAKPEDGALNMVNEWTRRAGVLPLDLTIFLDTGDYAKEFLDGVPEELEDLLEALRSLAVRWDTLALQTPWTFYEDLLAELEQTPQIVSFYAQVTEVADYRIYIPMAPIKFRRLLRPKYLYILDIVGFDIPFEWDNLVHLKTNNLCAGELLHVIRCAQNMEHCDATCTGLRSVDYPIPTTGITNRSLIHLHISPRHDDIIGLLTLPSLQHLEYSTSGNSQLDSLVRFVKRSSPLLHTFILHCEIQPWDYELVFGQLPEITHLSVTVNVESDDYELDGYVNRFFHALTKSSYKGILPCLKEFSLDLPLMTRQSWPLFSRLVSKDIQGKEVLTSSHVALGRPLSKVRVLIPNDIGDPMTKDTFLQLLAVRKSGVDLDIRLRSGVDFFGRMAEIYYVRL